MQELVICRKQGECGKKEWGARMTLAVGDIVTVTLKECIYFGIQGQVMEVNEDGDPGGPIGVKFNKWKDPWAAIQKDRPTVRFLESFLRKDDDWDPEIRVLECYGKYLCRSFFQLPDPFDPTKPSPCKTKGCVYLAVRRCLINIVGSVYEVDLCADCAKEYHGTCTEGWPTKGSANPAPAVP